MDSPDYLTCPKCKIKFDSYDEIVEHLENRQTSCRTGRSATSREKIDVSEYWTAQTSVYPAVPAQKGSSYHSMGQAPSGLVYHDVNQSTNNGKVNMDTFLQDLYALQIAKSVSAYCVNHGKACMESQTNTSANAFRKSNTEKKDIDTNRLSKIEESIVQLASELEGRRHSQNTSDRFLAEVERMLKTSTPNADIMVNEGIQTPISTDGMRTAVTTETDLLNKIMEVISGSVHDSQAAARPKTHSRSDNQGVIKKINSLEFVPSIDELNTRPQQKQSRTQRVKRVRRKTQTSPTLMANGPPSNYQQGITSSIAGGSELQGLDGFINQWSSNDISGIARHHAKQMAEAQTNLSGGLDAGVEDSAERIDQSQDLPEINNKSSSLAYYELLSHLNQQAHNRRPGRFTHTRSTALSRPEEAVEPIDRSNPFHMDHITDLIPPHEMIPGRLTANVVPHGDDQMLIPIRTAEGHINVIPLSLHQPHPAVQHTRQNHYYSLPHIMRTPLNSEVTTRANSADYASHIQPDFESWSPIIPLYRTNDNVQNSFRWQVPADTTPERNPRRGQRGVNNQTGLLNGDMRRANGARLLPPNLATAILQNYPTIRHLYEGARRESARGGSLPTIQPAIRDNQSRERQGSGPPSLETYIPYHTAQEEAYLTTSLSPPDYAAQDVRFTPTDLSLPTYDQSQGTVSWERLYVTTPTETINSAETTNTAPPKTVRWSIDREVIDTPPPDSRNRSTTPKDSIELLSDNRPLPVSEVRVNQTLQYPVRQTFHFKVSSANTIKSENIQRPNITLVNASSLTLQRARIGSAFGRVLMRLRHEKIFIVKEELYVLTPLKAIKAPSRRAEHMVVILYHNHNHFDQSKPLKIFELQKPKPKAIEQLDLYQTRKLKPVKVVRISSETNQAVMRYSQNVYSAKRPVVLSSRHNSQARDSLYGSRRGTQETEPSNENLIDKLRREHREQVERIRSEHGVPQKRSTVEPAVTIEESNSQETDDLVCKVKTVLSEHSKRSTLLKVLRDLVVKEKSGDVENQINPPSGVKTTTTDSVTSEQENEQDFDITSEQQTIMSKLQVLQNQQQTMAEMMENMNQLVRQFDSRAGSKVEPQQTSASVHSEQSSVELNKAGSQVVLSVNRTSSHHMSPDVRDRMDRIIGDWSHRRSTLPTHIPSLTLDSRSPRNSILGQSSPHRQNRREELRQKISLLRHAIMELETRLDGRTSNSNDNTLPLIMDFLRSTMARLPSQ